MRNIQVKYKAGWDGKMGRIKLLIKLFVGKRLDVMIPVTVTDHVLYSIVMKMISGLTTAVTLSVTKEKQAVFDDEGIGGGRSHCRHV
jgi:hypothetical protein